MLNYLLAKNTGQNVETIATDTERDKFLSAQEAVSYGLIDQVITSRDELTEKGDKKSHDKG